jgi:putative transposase
VCRKAGISRATYFDWKKYGGLLPDEMRRLKALEDEDARLKKIVADLTLDREMVSGRAPSVRERPRTDVIRRRLVRASARTGGAQALTPAVCARSSPGCASIGAMSIRGACGALRFDTSTFHDKSRRTDQAAVGRRIEEIAETRMRYGYRRVRVLLRREGWVIDMRKTRRIYDESGLRLRNEHPKRRVTAKLREDRQEAVGPNDVWAMDFVHDQLATGKTLRILTVVDTHSRYCPVVDPRFGYRGEDVVRTLEGFCQAGGHPKTIRVDNGSAFITVDRIGRPSISGPVPTTSSWTSRGRGSRPATGSSTARQGHASHDPGRGGVQQRAARRVSERPLVHEPCRRPRKAGCSAQGPQRGPAAQRHRGQRPGGHPQSRRISQPAVVIRGRRLQAQAVQRRGAEHKPADSRYERGNGGGGQVSSGSSSEKRGVGANRGETRVFPWPPTRTWYGFSRTSSRSEG